MRVPARVPGLKTVRKGEVLQVLPEVGAPPEAKDGAHVDEAAGPGKGGEGHEGEEMMVRVRFTSGEEALVERGSVTVDRQRSPIDAWPDAFIFFDRVLGLLRGLTATLDVSVSYLAVMTPFARAALRDYYTPAPHPFADGDAVGGSAGAEQLLQEADTAPGRVDRAGWEGSSSVRGATSVKGLRELVQVLVDNGLVLGCQVAVIQNGRVLADLAAGARDPYTLAAVRRDSLFNVFSVSKAVAAAAVHVLVERGLVDLDVSVCSYWQRFQANTSDVLGAGAGHASAGHITVRHVLNHQAGLADAGLDDMARDPYVVCDSEAMLAVLEEATPASAAGADTRYHYLTFGWLLEGIVRGVTGRTLADFVRNEMAGPLGLADEMMLGLGDSHEALKSAGRLTELTLRRTSANISGAPEPGAAAEGENRAAGDGTGGTGARGRRPVEGGMLLMNPTFFNNPRIRQASIPAANGHFSARALARFYWAMCDSSTDGLFMNPLNQGGGGGAEVGGWEQYGRKEQVGPKVDGEAMLQGGSSWFRLGLAIYPTAEQGRVMVGHAGIGGSIALCDPASGTTIAITLNRLSMDSSHTSGAILRLIFAELGLPCPQHFSPQDAAEVARILRGKKVFSGVPTEREKEWEGRVQEGSGGADPV